MKILIAVMLFLLADLAFAILLGKCLRGPVETPSANRPVFDPVIRSVYRAAAVLSLTEGVAELLPLETVDAAGRVSTGDQVTIERVEVFGTNDAAVLDLLAAAAASGERVDVTVEVATAIDGGSTIRAVTVTTAAGASKGAVHALL
jgi:hypothetical protein